MTEREDIKMARPNSELEDLAANLERNGAPWTCGETSMTALSDAQRRMRLGFVPPPGAPSLEELDKELKAGTPQAPFMAAAAFGAPPAYDLRNVGGKSYVTPIKDQRNCGSCVAFGCVAVLESSLKVAASDPDLDVDLSEAHLFYCHGRRRGRLCSTGWFPNEALDDCRDLGLAFEQSYPYTPGDQNCTGLAADWNARYATLSGKQPLSGAAIKNWIATRGPVTGCFVVYNDFFAYRSGIYRHVSGALAGGHCVALVGYDDANSCWIAKNSWGPAWGELGFFRIAYGECGIDSSYGPYGANGTRIQEQPQKAWSGWASEGGVITSDIVAGRNADGRLEVFVRGTDNALWHKYQVTPNGAWSDWTWEGGVLTSNVAVGQDADGRLEVFACGTDNALWRKYQVSPNGGWSDWDWLGGVFTSNIAVSRNADGRLEVFVRGTDNALWHKYQTSPNGGWSDWDWLGGVFTSNIAVGSNADGSLEVFVRGTDNALWHKYQTSPNGGWSDWDWLDGVFTSNITVGSNADGRLEVFVRGSDNAMWHKYQEAPNGGWSGWASEGGVLTSDIAVGRSPGGRLEVFVLGTDQALWHKWQEAPNGGWSDWSTEGGQITSNIVVGQNADGRLEVFVRGTDQALWHNWQVAPIQAVEQPRLAAAAHVTQSVAAERKALQGPHSPRGQPGLSKVLLSVSHDIRDRTMHASKNDEMPKGEMRSSQTGGMPKGEMLSSHTGGMPLGRMRMSQTGGMPKAGIHSSVSGTNPKPAAVRDASIQVFPEDSLSAALASDEEKYDQMETSAKAGHS